MEVISATAIYQFLLHHQDAPPACHNVSHHWTYQRDETGNIAVSDSCYFQMRENQRIVAENQ